MAGKRYRSIDVIKGVAIIMIILVHYEQNFSLCPAFKYLQDGCSIFFVASGFSISCLVSHKFGGGLRSRGDVKEFYRSRLLALAPAWYIAILLTFAVNSVLLGLFGRTLSFGKNREPVSILCNLLFLNGLLPFCNNSVMMGGWYVGATAVLYALTPAILAGLRRFRYRWAFFVLTSSAAVLLREVLRKTLGDGFSMDGFAYYVFLIHYPSYLLGILLHDSVVEKRLYLRQVKGCLPLSLLTYAAAITCYFYLHEGVLSSWATALATYFLLQFMLAHDACFENNPISRALMRMGKNTYCIFLMQGFFAHFFVRLLQNLLALIDVNAYTMPFFLVLMPVTIVLSCAGGALLRAVVQRTMRLVLKQ